MGFEEPKKDNLWEQKNLFNIDNIGKQGIIPEDENTNKSNQASTSPFSAVPMSEISYEAK